MKHSTDIVGKRFFKLTVTENLGWIPVGGTIHWRVNVICECGTQKTVSYYNLTSKNVVSCGCWRKNRSSPNKTHGLSKHPLYEVWTNMKRRCYDKKDSFYHRYGGRGIRVCDQWRTDFLSFYNWAIANCWQKHLRIDRIDPSGDYNTRNCRFVTELESARNKEDTVYLTYQGEKLPLTVWAERFGLHSCTLRSRINDNWDIKKALLTPKKQK